MTQDSRVFFNHHVPNTPAYQNTWDVREACLEVGSSGEGWFDVVAGRQIFSFGDERVIGPSGWNNMGHTFHIVRLDLHPSGLKVSIFASSVIVARRPDRPPSPRQQSLRNLPSFTRLAGHAILGSYLLWRVAPANVKLSEDAGLGHFSEGSGGAPLRP